MLNGYEGWLVQGNWDQRSLATGGDVAALTPSVLLASCQFYAVRNGTDYENIYVWIDKALVNDVLVRVSSVNSISETLDGFFKAPVLLS